MCCNGVENFNDNEVPYKGGIEAEEEKRKNINTQEIVQGAYSPPRRCRSAEQLEHRRFNSCTCVSRDHREE